jgi:pimeloyl-ACP methyl ester carboxylesterase
MTGSTLLRPGWREVNHQINGFNLHVVEAGNPDAPLLILLHGFPEFWWGWREQIGPLAAAGYHVIAPDMRGYNLSSTPPHISDYRRDLLVADIMALADAYSARRFDLVGHDWGAAIAWWVAAEHSSRLNHVVVLDGPHPGIWARQALRHRTQAVRSAYMAAFQLPVIPEVALRAFDFAFMRGIMRGTAHAATFGDDVLARYVEAWRQPGSLTAMLNYYRALPLPARNDDAARVTAPMLILWGTEDRFLERHVMEAGLALCNNGLFIAIEGATHWLHLEAPGRINGEIVRFLSSDKP